MSAFMASRPGATANTTFRPGSNTDKAARAITTALGYNQLLATNTVEIIAESGNQIVKNLLARAAALPDAEKTVQERKIAILRKMIAFAKSVPDDWNRHQALAGTRKGLGIHALNLDIDVGPLLQTQKLMDRSVRPP